MSDTVTSDMVTSDTVTSTTLAVAVLAVLLILILARYAGGGLREKFWAVRPGMAPSLEEGLAIYNWRRLAAGCYPPSRNMYNW